MDHTIFMKRAIDLADKALGDTFPNPVVGSVIVHQGQIIGEGFHKKAGEPHAEINAIRSVKNQELLRDSTIYVTLEPCSHYGKTPPCALKIIEKGFKEVVIGTLDDHEKVNGRGAAMLREAGISVISGIMEQECRELNRRFFTYHQKKRPYIILKWAQSADGFLDKDFHPYQISNRLSSQFVHQMRNNEHAILVGTKTAMNDDPSLTVRHLHGQNPVRVLIDFDLKIPTTHQIFNHEARTLIINAQQDINKGHLFYRKADKQFFLPSLMEVLYKEQIQSVMIEGGRNTLQQFIGAELWDEAVIIKNTGLHLHSGTAAPYFSVRAKRTISLRDNRIEFYRNDF